MRLLNKVAEYHVQLVSKTKGSGLFLNFRIKEYLVLFLVLRHKLSVRAKSFEVRRVTTLNEDW